MTPRFRIEPDRAPSGGWVHVRFDEAPPADSRVRVVQCWRTRDGELLREEVVGTCATDGSTAFRLRLPPLEPSRTGRWLALSYELRDDAGLVSVPLHVLAPPGGEPRDEDEPTTLWRIDVPRLVRWAAKALVLWGFVAMLAALTAESGVLALRGERLPVHLHSFDGVTTPRPGDDPLDVFVILLLITIGSLLAAFRRTARGWRALARRYPRLALAPRAVATRFKRGPQP